MAGPQQQQAEQDDDPFAAALANHRASSDDDACSTSGGGKEQEAEEMISAARKRRLFLACACILGNELCERLAFYGLQTNLGLYLKKQLHYPTDQASQLLQAWKGSVYVTPLLGAYLADAMLGRFWVILIFSCVYFVGMLGITLLNLIPAVKPSRDAVPPAGLDVTRAVFWAFMYLTALGSGGIKPCVSSFGGDQFRESSPRERSYRSSFFNWFYFAINVGALVASTVVVGVQEARGYGIGFSIPTAAFAAAITMFVAGAAANLYVRVPPEGSPFSRIGRVLKGAWVKRHLVVPEDPADLHEPARGSGDPRALPFTMPHTRRMRCLDKAAIRSSCQRHPDVTRTEVEETKAFFGILSLFAIVCIYQMCSDPISTLLPYPGDAMDRRLGSTMVPASSISFTNTFGVLFMVVAYDLGVVPLARRCGRPMTMTTRIGIGFALQIVALSSAALIEMARYRTIRAAGLREAFEAAGPGADPLDPAFMQPMSVWWQAVPYFLSGASEVFTNVGCMEAFYVQVSEGMRSLGTSVYLLSIAVGTYMASSLNKAVAAGTAGDPWLADNPLAGHYDRYFWLNAGILGAGLVAYVAMARRWTDKPVEVVKSERHMEAAEGKAA